MVYKQLWVAVCSMAMCENVISANLFLALSGIFARKKGFMKNHILFSYKNWKNELRGAVDKLKALLQGEISAEARRAAENEKEIKENLMFVEDELADAFTEINDERRRVTTEIARASAAESVLQLGVESVEKSVSALRSVMTVRFDGVQTSEVNVLSGVADSEPAEVLFYRPMGVFIVKTFNETYYSEWEGSELYMSGGSLRKDKVYLCGGAVYVWDGRTLNDVVAGVNESLTALTARVQALENKVS